MRRGLLAGAILLLAACSSGSVAPEPTTTYRLRLEGADLRGALISLGGVSGEVQVLADGVLAEVTAGAAPLVLLVGSLDGAELLEVRTAEPGTAPTAAIVEASGGQASGYRRMTAGEVTVEWVEVR